jgi:hypothetical protein
MTIKDQVKQIIREVVSSRGTNSQYRLGTVQAVNGDGTCAVMIDGNAVSATPLYPLVLGQQAIVVFAPDGSASAIPTSPNTAQVEFTPPPFFTGGVLKFAAGPQIQQAFSSKIYQILASDLVGYQDLGSWFSPDGTRIVVIWGKSGNSDVHYRVYDIGQSMASTATIDPVNQIFQAKATLLFEIIRTLNWGDWAHSPPIANIMPEPAANFDNFTGIVNSPVIAALDNDPNQLYWAEHQSVDTLLSGLGDPVEIVSTYKLDVNKNPVLMGKWTVAFVGQPGSSSASAIRSVFYLGEVGIRGVAFGTPSGFFDPATTEIFTQAISNPFGTDNILTFPPYTPLVYGILTPSGASYSVPASGGFSATTVPNGPNVVFNSGIQSNVDQVNPSHHWPPSRMKKFNAMLFAAPPNDFINIVYEDTKTLVKTLAKFTNPISTSGNTLNGDCLFLMSSQTKGLLIDSRGHVRKAVSTDGGATFTIDTDTSKYLRISPGQTDPTVVRGLSGRGFTAVSTIP